MSCPSTLLIPQLEDLEVIESGHKGLDEDLELPLRTMQTTRRPWGRWRWWRGRPPPGFCSGRPRSSPPSPAGSTARSAGNRKRILERCVFTNQIKTTLVSRTKTDLTWNYQLDTGNQDEDCEDIDDDCDFENITNDDQEHDDDADDDENDDDDEDEN